MHKSATKCNETIGKWCKNKHGASKIIDTFETYHATACMRWRRGDLGFGASTSLPRGLRRSTVVRSVAEQSRRECAARESACRGDGARGGVDDDSMSSGRGNGGIVALRRSWVKQKGRGEIT
jgi:hypothetical protein